MPDITITFPGKIFFRADMMLLLRLHKFFSLIISFHIVAIGMQQLSRYIFIMISVYSNHSIQAKKQIQDHPTLLSSTQQYHSPQTTPPV
jgi:hypothetical protein